MSVELWIDDGNPWYLSPDIWVVPGPDPSGTPGLPTEGVGAYLWARVHNRGKTDVSGASVRWYWADPSTLITPTSAHLVGSSYVSLVAGETKEVLCLVRWIPSYVNGGHECLLAEAFAPVDPLPPRGPNDPFSASTDRHTAQRNIHVAPAPPPPPPPAPAIPMRFAFAAAHPGRASGAAEIVLKARALGGDAFERLRPSLGKLELKIIEPKRIGLSLAKNEQQAEPRPELRVKLDVGRSAVVHLTVELGTADARSAAFVVVEQLAADKVVGGVAVLATAAGFRLPDPKKV